MSNGCQEACCNGTHIRWIPSVWFFYFDWTIDKLHSKLRDTIKNREVPYELLEEVNDFIDEMKSIAEDDEIDEDEASYDGELDENLV